MLIIGLGTGRCGSMSLAHLLNDQKGCACTHEMTFDYRKLMVTPLDITNTEQADKYLESINRRMLPIKADISLWWLWFVDHIVDKYGEDVRFLCLKRDRIETQNSYNKKFNNNGKPPGINPLQEHDGTEYRKDAWDKSYPKYLTDTRFEAIGLYWDDYYKRADEFEKKYPNQFKIVNLQDLNDYEKISEILEFCNIEAPDLVIKKSNKGK
jgi:hypothetical protein